MMITIPIFMSSGARKSYQRKETKVPAFFFGLFCGIILALLLFVTLSNSVTFVSNILLGPKYKYVKVSRENAGLFSDGKERPSETIRLEEKRGNVSIAVQILQEPRVKQTLSLSYWSSMDRSKASVIPQTLAEELHFTNKLSISVINPSKKTSSVASLIPSTWAEEWISLGKKGFSIYSNAHDISVVQNLNMPILEASPYNEVTPSSLMIYQVLSDLCYQVANSFHFFFIVNSNTYVNIEELENLLSKINESEIVWLGHGEATLMKDKYFTNDPEVYCKIGPGFALSRRALLGVCPFVRNCEDDFSSISSPPGLEIARCFYKYLGVKCSSSVEAAQLFYSPKTLPKPYSTSGDIDPYAAAVTTHPVPDETMMYFIHQYFTEKKLNQSIKENDYFYNVVQSMDKVLVKEQGMQDDRLVLGRQGNLNKYYHEDIIAWDVIEKRKLEGGAKKQYIYSINNKDPIAELDESDEKVFDKIREVALMGVKSRISSKMNLTTENTNEFRRLLPGYGYQYIITVQSDKEMYNVQVDQAYDRTVVLDSSVAESSKIVFVLPIQENVGDFKAYMQMFEQACLSVDQPENLALLLVIYHEKDGQLDDKTSELLQTLNLYKQKYPKLSLSWINGGAKPYSYIKALHMAVVALPIDTLICSTDIRMQMYPDFLHHVRLNAVLHERLFFPIPFQLFDKLKNGKTQISHRTGFWRNFDYNTFCGHKRDIIQAYGGEKFKSSEDFMQRSILSGFDVLRAPESNLFVKPNENNCLSINLDEDQVLYCNTEQKFTNIALSIAKIP